MFRKPIAITLPFTNIDTRKCVCLCCLVVCVLKHKTFPKQLHTLLICQGIFILACISKISTISIHLASSYLFTQSRWTHVQPELSASCVRCVCSMFYWSSVCVVSRVNIFVDLWAKTASRCFLCVLNTTNSSVCRHCQRLAAQSSSVCVFDCVEPLSLYVVKQRTHSLWLFPLHQD